MTTTPLVRLRDVGKTFASGTVALEGLNLDIRPGEFLSLVGPSGCGKSTALRIVAGLSAPTRGRVEWHAEACGADPPSRDSSRVDPTRARGIDPGQSRDRGDVGFVFQDPTLMPWASVAENVRLPLRLKGTARESAARVHASLALVGLSSFADAYPRELSGGMRMRVSIARALVTDPELLLMDEPFAALDEITRFRLNDDLLRLQAELRCTIVFVTHSVYESVYLSSRIVVMAARPGRAIAEIHVDAPSPRDESFRSSARYADCCRRASAALHGALDPAASL